MRRASHSSRGVEAAFHGRSDDWVLLTTGDGRRASALAMRLFAPGAQEHTTRSRPLPVPELPDLTIVCGGASGTLHGSPRARCVGPHADPGASDSVGAGAPGCRSSHHERQATRQVPPPHLCATGRRVLILAANPMLAGRFWLLDSGKARRCVPGLASACDSPMAASCATSIARCWASSTRRAGWPGCHPRLDRDGSRCR